MVEGVYKNGREDAEVQIVTMRNKSCGTKYIT